MIDKGNYSPVKVLLLSARTWHWPLLQVPQGRPIKSSFACFPPCMTTQWSVKMVGLRLKLLCVIIIMITIQWKVMWIHLISCVLINHTAAWPKYGFLRFFMGFWMQPWSILILFIKSTNRKTAWKSGSFRRNWHLVWSSLWRKGVLPTLCCLPLCGPPVELSLFGES